jgi:pimeloyl-ACP methyl ester carboxylesterase
VPLDYAKPAGAHLSIALVRLHRSGETGTRALLTNPGGPGASGLEFAMSLAPALPAAVTRKFDVVGFDPRGVGSSRPLRCQSDAKKDAATAADPDVRTTAGFAQAKQLARDFVAACRAKYGDTLDDFTTMATARDLDRIRAALGEDDLTYLGFSYGTELGAQYAHLFPHRVGALVLDGAVDPLADDIASFADQLAGFEQAFDQFAAWCRQHQPCSALGDPRRSVYDLAAQARSAPLRSSAPGEKRTVTGSMVELAVLSGLYSQSYWTFLGNALIAAKHGDARGLLQLVDLYNQRDSDGHFSNIADANAAIGCNDSEPGPSDATIRATARSWVRRFPLFGRSSVPALFTCQQWPADRTVPPRPTARTADAKILVVGNVHDPATPYQGAKNLTRTLGNAVLLTWDGEGHTSYLQGRDCVVAAVDAYLLDGSVPPAGTTCPA